MRLKKKGDNKGLGSPGLPTSCPAPPRATLARHRPGRGRPSAAGGQRPASDPGPSPSPVALRVRAPTLAHLRSAFSSGLRCVRRCRLRAWGGPPLAASGLAPRWPGTMSGRVRPAGAPVAAAGLPDRSSTLGAPAAGLCAGATTTMARACLHQRAPPPSAGRAPPHPGFLRSWPSAIGQ